jgi:ankyrin repeat protein
MNITPVEVYRYLIETLGADVNVQDDNCNTPIHWALGFFDPTVTGVGTNVLMYLLSRKDVNVNIKDNYGYTLLHYACGNINSLPLEIFKSLIETIGFDVNAQASNKDTPLHRALRFFDPNDGGDINLWAYLIAQKGINVNIKNSNGHTLLHTACININSLPIDVFKLLIEMLGCNINAQDKCNDTPLHHALRFFDPNYGGDITVLAYLINQKNINVNTKYKRDHTLLHTACIINLSNFWHSAELSARYDTILSQIVELIAERCVQEVFDAKTPLEATMTM